MKKYIATLLSISLIGCNAGGSGSNNTPTSPVNSTEPGTLSVSPFSGTVVNVYPQTYVTATVTLNNSSGVTNLQIIPYSESNSFTFNPQDIENCVLSTESPTCTIAVTGQSPGAGYVGVQAWGYAPAVSPTYLTAM